MGLQFQFWNDSSFQTYAAADQKLLRDSLFETPRPSEVQLPRTDYVVTGFLKVEHGGAVQKNQRTGFSRRVRIQPPYTISGAASAPMPKVCFCFEDGRNGATLKPYAPELQKELNQFLSSSPRPTEVFFSANGAPYLLWGMENVQDVNSTLQQVNLATKRVRTVRIMLEPSVPSAPSAPSAPSSGKHRSAGGAAPSSYGPGRNPLVVPGTAPPTPARAGPFSLSSASFLSFVDGRRERLQDGPAKHLLRHWKLDERPSQVALPGDLIVEHFEALEEGRATLRKRGASFAHKLEVKFPPPHPGSLRLPADLEEEEVVDIKTLGKILTDQEISALGADKQCAICMDDMEPQQPNGRQWQVHLDEDGDVEMGEESNPSFSWARSAPSVAGVVFQLRCGHTYHKSCLSTWLQQKTKCPSCQQELGKVVGKQPRNGTLSWHCEDFSLPGHPDAAKTIVIQFVFPDGVDDEGKKYSGRKPKGYLPCNAQGIMLLEMFKVAFRRRVMFGLGESMTFSSYRPTFNIHIKTSSTGGETKHGYPDANYFRRSLEELRANGVSVMDLHS
mmetsp:Transcript_36687/g.84642  ORF Transcript_36687/g.84642 Transcript_36687/m.84642 type:complete len:558 (-) Transcript_36687:73-1746(-)